MNISDISFRLKHKGVVVTLQCDLLLHKLKGALAEKMNLQKQRHLGSSETSAEKTLLCSAA